VYYVCVCVYVRACAGKDRLPCMLRLNTSMAPVRVCSFCLLCFVLFVCVCLSV
jgi:hypothetical protein